MKNRSNILFTIVMVACAATSCIFLTKSVDFNSSSSSVTITQEPIASGLILTASDIKLGFENLTRSAQNIVSPFNKINDGSYYEFVKKFHSTFTKVSFKYLYFLHFFQCKEESLFLDLRKILI